MAIYYSLIRHVSLSFASVLYYCNTKLQKRGKRDVVGIRIAQLRQDRGFKQADLADLLHISASAVGMYEQGRRLPSLNTVISLCQIFDVTADYLLTGKEPQK